MNRSTDTSAKYSLVSELLVTFFGVLLDEGSDIGFALSTLLFYISV